MTDREKLVDLINHVAEGHVVNLMQPGGAEALADYLIANSVTVREWIGVEDGLPKNEQEVIGWEGDYAKILCYDAEFNEWNDENGWRWELDKFPHWMSLPEPPKEKRRCHV